MVHNTIRAKTYHMREIRVLYRVQGRGNDSRLTRASRWNASRLWRRRAPPRMGISRPRIPDVRPARGKSESNRSQAASQEHTTTTAATTMSTFHPGESSSHPYREPAPLPDTIPKVNELGATSAPLKSAAFFIGAYCKEFNGGCGTYS